ncbi:MAG: hypothetical protein SFU85_02425 [Candidatus Methylacidiphilales bacterium]|nr:hypothetical protein [Candidatus Methylacidiphilales bacterium]
MQRALCLLVLVGALGSPVRAADNEWVPGLGEAFPLAVKDGRVVLTESVLVTPIQILPAGTLARNIFPIPEEKVIASTDKNRRREQFKERYGSKESQITAVDPENDPRLFYERAVQTLAGQEAWTGVDKFAAFLQAAPADSFLFAFQESASSPPGVSKFQFPEKLLLSESAGAIRVRAVVAGSAPGQAGLRAGDRLVRVGSTELQGSLKTWMRAFPLEKEKAQIEGRPLSVAYLPADGGELRTAEIRVPISLKSNAGLFNDIPLDSKPAPKPDKPQVETLPPDGP